MFDRFVPRAMPEALAPLFDLALDLHWTWSHAGDSLWRKQGPLWERTNNPWAVLQDVSQTTLESWARDPAFLEELRRVAAERERYLTESCWCGENYPELAGRSIAYFSMEFGLGQALPLYAGGLGVLAGDFLKTASDLGIPVTGVGLLYYEGYFRQTIDAAGRQHEAYPYNDPGELPIRPVMDASGSWLRVEIKFPGRILYLRTWVAQVGRVRLYRLDSNDPMNSPVDRGITAKLYGGGIETRLMQEMVLQRGQQGATPEHLDEASQLLDANFLTLGFARRFAEYKRPNLLLADADRFARILGNPDRPVQIIVAGKAHPDDATGKRLVEAWLQFAKRADVQRRVVFIADYDMVVAQQLVQGVDVWINTPRRPWEACGTSGMKVLANGGLNLSALDGWWAEAYAPELGWTLSDRDQRNGPEQDQEEALQLYRLLENEVVPAFYERDDHGIPRAWVRRMRASIATLAPRYSSNRMAGEYVEKLYRPAAAMVERRGAEGARLGHELSQWHEALTRHWHEIHFGAIEIHQEDNEWRFSVPVYLGEIPAESVRVELYSEPADGDGPIRMDRTDQLPGALNAFIYRARVDARRPSDHYTPRVIPYHPAARVPIECNLIAWQR